MSVMLTKGGNVSLSKQAPGLKAVVVGLGWDQRTTSGAEFDLDASAMMINESGKIVSDAHFVFFNNLRSPDGSVEHAGDNLTGHGDGDDEKLTVDLATVPTDCDKVIFPVTVHEAAKHGHSFGQVRNAFIRVVDRDSGEELARYDLSEDASTDTAMIFGELYRSSGDWKFRAVGQGYTTGLAGIAAEYGVNLG